MGKLLRIFIASLLLGLIPAHAARGQVRCASYLGICSQRFPCESALAVFSGIDNPCIGWLHTTFGARCECPKRFLAIEGDKIARVHVVNGTCFKERGRVCAKDEVFYQETIASADSKFAKRNPAILRKYRRKLQEVRLMTDKAAPGLDLYISPCLESPLGSRARRTMHAVAREVFPGVSLVDSVLTQKCLSRAVCEKHGSKARVPAGGILDTDGEDYRVVDVQTLIERNPGAALVFAWEPSFNLLCPSYTSFVLPLQRICGPTRDDLREIREWLAPSSGL